jgi:hypothetical protein
MRAQNQMAHTLAAFETQNFPSELVATMAAWIVSITVSLSMAPVMVLTPSHRSSAAPARSLVPGSSPSAPYTYEGRKEARKQGSKEAGNKKRRKEEKKERRKQ